MGKHKFFGKMNAFRKKHGAATALLNIVIIFSCLAGLAFAAKSYTSTSLHLYYDINASLKSNDSVTTTYTTDTVHVGVPGMENGGMQFSNMKIKGADGLLNWTIESGSNDSQSADYWSANTYGEYTISKSTGTVTNTYKGSDPNYLETVFSTVQIISYGGGTAWHLAIIPDVMCSSDTRIEIRVKTDTNRTGDNGLLVSAANALSTYYTDGYQEIGNAAAFKTVTLNPAAGMDGKTMKYICILALNATVGVNSISVDYIKFVNINVGSYFGYVSVVQRVPVDGLIPITSRKMDLRFIQGELVDDVNYNFTMSGTLHLYDVDELPEISSQDTPLKSKFTMSEIPDWVDSATLDNVTLLCHQVPVSTKVNGETSGVTYTEITVNAEYTCAGLTLENKLGENYCLIEINYDATFASATVWIAMLGSLADWANWNQIWASLLVIGILATMLLLFYRRSGLHKILSAKRKKRSSKPINKTHRVRTRVSNYMYDRRMRKAGGQSFNHHHGGR